jgi:hypothetical protein
MRDWPILIDRESNPFAGNSEELLDHPPVGTPSFMAVKKPALG